MSFQVILPPVRLFVTSMFQGNSREIIRTDVVDGCFSSDRYPPKIATDDSGSRYLKSKGGKPSSSNSLVVSSNRDHR